MRFNALPMFEDYQQKVLQDYQQKKNKKLLSQFDHITPALLKREFVNILKERKEFDKDLLTLRAFFGADERQRGYEKIIEDFPTPGFRALSNFFRAHKKPDRINTELIAWLIDFQPRPYQSLSGYEISSSLAESNGVDDDIVVKQEAPEVAVKTVPKEPNDEQESTVKTVVDKKAELVIISKKYYKTLGAFLCVLLVLIAFYIYSSKNQQCMYWTGDHYESIACDQKASAAVVALDTFRVSYLKKIGKRDTITASSIGKVYYSKVKIDSVDFYTSGGDHPTNSTKRLLPMTQYILDKYVPNHK